MLQLQNKAHLSLDEFRRGKGLPMPRIPRSPDSPEGEDDELSVLGGRTRLVSKKEPSSPTLQERSPTSQNPIVPLPLSPGLHNQLPPSVREYLDSFKISGNQHSYSEPPAQVSPTSHRSQGSFSDAEISPVTMYGMSGIPSVSFQTESPTYLAQQPMQGIVETQPSPHRRLPSMDTSMNRNGAGFNIPQYFPVYDYGLASTSYNNGGNPFVQEHGHFETNPAPGQRRPSGSPDTNMQSTWLDFVNTMAMQ